jgi:hypothetical protein
MWADGSAYINEGSSQHVDENEAEIARILAEEANALDARPNPIQTRS